MAVPQLDHVLQRMKGALKDKERTITTLNTELIELQPKYDRFLDVAKQLNNDQDLVYKLRAILARSNTVKDDDIRENGGVKLWEVIEVYLRYAREAQIANIEYFLNWAGLKANRQAIESAVKTHPEVFRQEKHGREKFISLKGEIMRPPPVSRK